MTDAPPDSAESAPASYTIDELAAASGVPSRTIRFYQSKGALPKPEKRGRVAYYGPEHLERLGLIGQLQDRGLSIRAIRDLVLQIERGELALNEWLGLEEQLQAAWADDRPQVMSEEALQEFTGELRPGLLARMIRQRLLSHQGTDYLLPSPGLVQVALRLEKAGIDLEVAGGAHEILTKHLRRAAEELGEYFKARVGVGFGRELNVDTVAQAFAVLKPLGLESVRLVFAHEMERVLRHMVESGAAAKVHGERKRRGDRGRKKKREPES